MKKLIKNLVLFLIFAIHVVSFSQSKSNSDVNVKKYITNNGKIVEEHKRTEPNSTKNDNFSTQGKVNPYTGKAGTVPRDNNNNTNNHQALPVYEDYKANEADLNRRLKTYDMQQERIKESSDRARWAKESEERQRKKELESIRPLPPITEIIDVLADQEKAIKYNNSNYNYSDRMLIKAMLSRLGYIIGDIDGVIDGPTISAIELFQARNRLEVDGCVGKQTMTVLINKF